MQIKNILNIVSQTQCNKVPGREIMSRGTFHLLIYLVLKKLCLTIGNFPPCGKILLNILGKVSMGKKLIFGCNKRVTKSLDYKRCKNIICITSCLITLLKQILLIQELLQWNETYPKLQKSKQNSELKIAKIKIAFLYEMTNSLK